jgi:acyl-CoA thioester hydrolase
MDAFDHVNNSLYFSYFEIARIEWWHQIMPEHLPFDKIGPVLINASCTFLKPIQYPTAIRISLFAGPAGRSSYEHFYQIHAETDTNLLYAEGMTKVVWVDRALGKSVPLPDAIRRHLPIAAA